MSTPALIQQNALTLLQQWCNGVKIAQIAHNRAAVHYKLRGRMLGTPVTILTMLISTSVFSTIKSSDNHSTLMFVAIISVIAAILSGVQTFLNYPELAAKHYTAGVKYGSLRRHIEEVMTFTRDVEELRKTMNEIRSAWDQLEGEAPDVPQRFHDKALRIVKPALTNRQDKEGV